MSTQAATELGVRWITWLRDVARKPDTTWKTYTKTLVSWIEWCAARDVDPLDPPLERLEEFTLRRRVRFGTVGAPATRKREIAALRGWYKWLYGRALIARDPGYELLAPTVHPTRGRPISDEHWIAIWAATQTESEIVGIGFAYYAGLRTVEVRSVHGAGLGTDLVHITRKGGKEQVIPWRDLAWVVHQRKPALLPDMRKLENAVARLRYFDGWGGRILPPRAKESYLRTILTQTCRRAGVPNTSPHRLRDSFAERMLNPPFSLPERDVADLMGHSSTAQLAAYTTPAHSRLKSYFPEIADKNLPRTA